MYNNPMLDQIIERLHWSNTQPMWKQDNMEKGNRYASFNDGTRFVPLTLNIMQK